MADSDEHPNDEDQIRDAPAGLSSPAEKKTQVEKLEQRLRRFKAQATAWDNAAEAHVKDILDTEFAACVELDAKVQSAEQAVEEAQEYLQICRTELRARATLCMEAIREAGVKRDERRANADRKIQTAQERLDKARQEMTLDVSPPGESG